MQEDRIWLIDKPLGWTSFDVVAKVRNALTRAIVKRAGIPARQARIKVGHAGTLDPQATGLLVLATGKRTKDISAFELLEKEYTGTFKLGAKTKSYDSETEEYDARDVSGITRETLVKTAQGFLGKQVQTPPMFSATWHQGKRLYDLAREGKEVERKEKPIEVFEFDLTDFALPEIGFRLRVSKGTYIRTIAFDFGEALGTGAYLKSLRRTKVGHYRIEDALSIEQAVSEIQGTPIVTV